MKYQLKMRRPVSGLVNGVKINLLSDLEKIMDNQLQQIGVTRKDPDDPITDYFRFQRRTIEPRPRRIHKAKGFTCPIDYAENLKVLEERIEKGESLTPFLSKRILNLNQEDMMLYDWNIYHFHISGTKDPKDNRFMARSGPLLMACIMPDDAYFLCVAEHDSQNPDKVWADTSYIQILRDNWPELLEKYRIPGAKLVESVDSKAIYDLRKHHSNTFTELDGDLYALIGGGYATDGSSNYAVRWADTLKKAVTGLEEFVSVEFWILSDKMPELDAKIDKDLPPEIKLVKILNMNEFILIERYSKTVFKAQYIEGENRHFSMDAIF